MKLRVAGVCYAVPDRMGALDFLPRVSVVVPVRNCEVTIEACLHGLVHQNYPRDLVEILVVDNDSTDDTAALAARYPVTLLAEKEIRSSYAARNRGVAHARGEVVAFTDGDCVPAPDWLVRLVAPLRDPAVGASVGTVVDAEPRSACEALTARVNPFARPVVDGMQTLLTLNAAVRRSAFDAVGGFDERLPTGGDVDLGWRLQRHGHVIAEAAEARVSHRHRSTFRGVFSQFRRYGLSEVLLGTLHRRPDARVSRQAGKLNAQLRAIGTYVLGFCYRSVLLAAGRCDRREWLWPLFLFVVETANVTGKIEGLVRTRGYRALPHSTHGARRSAGICAGRPRGAGRTRR